MPTYTIVIWNVQDFGGGADSDARFGTNGMYRANFIAAYLKSLNADMFGLIEMKPQAAVAALDQLLLSLNRTETGNDRDWACDSIKSALQKDVNLTSKEATTWVNGGPRREGYAFFWRTGRGFTAVPAARTISEGAEARRGITLPSNNYLDLVTSGRSFERNAEKGFFEITSGFTQASTKPVKDNKTIDWQALDFLTVSRAGSSKPTYFNTRRPAFVVIKTASGSDQATLLPVVFYHCPSYARLASFSVGISSFAMQHYVTYPLKDDGKPDPTKLTVINNVVSAGDYNYSAANDWPGWYLTYTEVFKKTPDGGVNATALIVPGMFQASSRTTIQLNDQKNGRFDGDPIDSTNADDYRRLSIDNLFYRGLTKATGSGTQNLIDKIMDSGNAMKDEIKAFRKILNDALESDEQYPKVDQGGPYTEYNRKVKGVTITEKSYVIPNILNWDTFYDCVKQGHFSGQARAAAQFVRYFVSDHLPLIMKFTV